MRSNRALVPAALLAALFSISACSGNSGGASAEEMLAGARTATAALDSFAFRSVTELPGEQALQRTVVEGKVDLPDKLTYTVKVDDGGAEVVRLGTSGYTRTLPGGPWTPDAATEQSVAPGVVLQEVLQVADKPTSLGRVTFDGRNARLITVVLTADEVRSTGLLKAEGGSDVTVQVALDDSNRVVRMALEIPVQGKTGASVVRQVITYGSFGENFTITAPSAG